MYSHLDVVKVCKKFKSREVVKSVTLSVNRGEVIGLLGPNGAGKTTCFNMVVGLEFPDLGSVWLDDENITRLPIYARAKKGIGYLPQEASIFRRMTVEQNVMALLETRNDLTRGAQIYQLEFLLEEFKIIHLRKQKSTVLSGGERRRVEIARAFALDPYFLLLDEPFAGVDPLAVEELMDLITQLQDRKVGILITDHSVRETLRICSRCYIMNRGEVIAQGSAAEIANNYQVREHYLGENFRM